MTRNITSKLFLFTVMAFLFLLGLLLIYRSTMTPADWKEIKGKVISKRSYSHDSYKSGTTYFAAFRMSDYNETLAISFGKDSEMEEKVSAAVKVGDVYTFYTDPTTFGFGQKYSVQKIDFNSTEIYKNSSDNRQIGIFLILFTSVMIFLLVKFPRKTSN